MKPEESNPQNFQVESILYNNGEFAIAYGTWTQNNNKCIAMRWTGDQNDFDDKGYPKVFLNPMWFIVDNDLTIQILKSIIALPSSKNMEIAKVIDKLMNNIK